MKLLFDENLSPRLVSRLGDIFPGSAHVGDVGLATADDEKVWNFAIAGGFTIVSKDDDFRERVRLRGHPPRVIFVRLGNCSTTDIERAIRENIALVHKLDATPDASMLLITKDGTLWLVRHRPNP